MKRLRLLLMIAALPLVPAACPDDEDYDYEYPEEEVDSSVMGPSIIVDRLAHRFCRRHDVDGTVSIASRVHRITPDNLDLSRGDRVLLVEFTCDGKTADVSHRLRRRKLGPTGRSRMLTLERAGEGSS